MFELDDTPKTSRGVNGPFNVLDYDPIKEELITSEGKLKMIWALRHNNLNLN